MGHSYSKAPAEEQNFSISIKPLEGSCERFELEKTYPLFATTYKKTILLPCCKTHLISVSSTTVKPLKGVLHIFLDQNFRNRALCGLDHNPVHLSIRCKGKHCDTLLLKPGITKVCVRQWDLRRIKMYLHVNHKHESPCETCPMFLYIKGRPDGDEVVTQNFLIRVVNKHMLQM
jgi:hypothetical protein